MTRTRTRLGASIAAAALSVVLAACGTTSTTASAAPNSGAAAQAATTPMPTSGSMTMQPGADSLFTATDVTFAQQMLVHHQDAVAMADLAPTRASSAKVKALAVQIKAEQTPEIKKMMGWLAVWAPHSAMTGMSSSTGAMGGMSPDDASSSPAMPGMMTGEQMSELTAAKGTQFDKLFLELMIVHHRGAVTMAKTEKADGANTAALALADSIISGQGAEIITMQGLLKGL